MFSSKKNVQATVVDSTLVVSFLSAGIPKVWRMDLGRFISAALEIQEKPDGYSLIMKTGGGVTEEVGTFPDRKKAEEVLRLISDAFLRGAVPPVKKSGFWRALWRFILFTLLLLVILGALLFSWNAMKVKIKEPVVLPQSAPIEAPVESQVEPQTAPPAGVPLPADEILGK